MRDYSSIWLQAPKYLSHKLRLYWWFFRNSLRGVKVIPPLWMDKPRNVHVGQGTKVGPYVYVSVQNPKGYLRVGCHCELNPFSVFLCGHGIEIGDYVLLAPGVKVITSSNAYEPNWLIASNPHTGGKVVIEDNVWVGSDAVILPGVTIGEGSVIGAGAVVTRDIPKGTVAYGVPCKPAKRRA